MSHSRVTYRDIYDGIVTLNYIAVENLQKETEEDVSYPPCIREKSIFRDYNMIEKMFNPTTATLSYDLQYLYYIYIIYSEATVDDSD